VLINGEATDRVSALDRGLQYGDGLFETIAVFYGRPALWNEHCARLVEGCRRLAIPSPDLGLLQDEAVREIGGADRGVLKIVITRGGGGRGYRPSAVPQPTRILNLSPWPDQPADAATAGVRLRLCNLRLGDNPALVGIKHLNRLEQVLARMEWDDPDIYEGILLDQSGKVAEGTMSNLFLWRRGRLITPELSRCGVAGVARGAISATAEALGLPVETRPVALTELWDAELLLISNSLIGLWPVRQLEETRYNPDSIPGELLAALRKPLFQTS